METLLWILAILLVVVGLAGMVLPLLPGTPLLFGGLWVAAAIDDYQRVGPGMLVLLAVLGLMAWLVDYVAAIWTVRRAGASQRAMAGAGAGTLAGLFAGWPGLVFGPVIGAMAGEWSRHRQVTQALKAGAAAGAGFLVAVLVKLLLALVMLILFLMAYLG